MIRKKEHCTCCLSTSINTFIDFGEVPPAGDYIKSVEETQLFPLSLSVCTACYHVQVNEYIDKETLFKDYRYRSNFSMKSHFAGFAERVQQRFGRGLNILEIGSNDGTFIDFLIEDDHVVTGIEPSSNVGKVSIDKGHTVINDFFSKQTLIDNKVSPESADIITASNCFAHIENIDVIVDGVGYALKADGTFIIEVHYGPNLIDSLQYDFIYHEHMYYYSLSSMRALLKRHGMHIYDMEHIPIHGGSIRFYVSKTRDEGASFLDSLEEEAQRGFHDPEKYAEFKNKVTGHMSGVRAFLEAQRGKRIVGYGASGRVNAFLNYADIGNSIIECIIDESPERYGRMIPKQNIPIVPPEAVAEKDFDILFVTAWNFFDQIVPKTKHLHYEETLTVFPEINLLKK